jgi:hypothetical protein
MIVLLTLIAVAPAGLLRADVVTDWNWVIHDVMQDVPSKANPGTSTRAIAMMNGAIYDVYQAFDRQYEPLIVHHMKPAANANLDAAVAQAARDVLIGCYGEEALNINSTFTNYMNAIADTPANKAAGSSLGSAIAAKYIHKRLRDHSGDSVQYTGPGGIGHWTTDPRITPAQEAWGPGWGTVHTWVLPSSAYFDTDSSAPTRYEVPGPPALNSPAYTEAYEMLLDYGALADNLRTQDQKEIGLFWAYDRQTIGPPPVLFIRNLIEIADQTANTPADNARMFAMASVAMSDAAVASWDIKFKDDFWRPITAIRNGNIDGNDDTTGVSDWEPLGSPNDPLDPTKIDFTPPFPAYTSGHATMGGALFKSLEMFFGTNDFADIPGADGAGENGKFRLTSMEADSGGYRDYSSFMHTDGLLQDLLTQANPDYTPDGENALSRIFLGVHWIFDQQDGMDLGHAIAEYVGQNRFAAVPEPAAGTMSLMLTFAASAMYHRRRV